MMLASRPERRFKTGLRWSYGLINRGVLIGDFISMLVLSSATLYLTVAGISLIQIIVLAAVNALIFVATLQLRAGYRVERFSQRRLVTTDLVVGLTLSISTLSVLLFAFVGQLVALWVCYSTLLAGLGIYRYGAHRAVNAIYQAGFLRRKVAVVGDPEKGLQLAARLMQDPHREQVDVIAVFAKPNQIVTPAVRGQQVRHFDELLEHAKVALIDMVVVCPDDKHEPITEQLRWIIADVLIFLDLDRRSQDCQMLVPLAGSVAVRLVDLPLRGSQKLSKSLEDYVLASLGLILLSPLLLLIALAIKLDSPGPFIFKQPRTGLNNRPFLIYKFRTMKVDECDDGVDGTQGRNDPRITRFGLLLRRTSLDELPQLFNVLIGEMSIVGPRAYVPNMLVDGVPFQEMCKGYIARHRVKPGITGWAQVNNLRGEAIRTSEGALNSVEHDLAYIKNWNLWWDIKIMLKTITVLTGKNVF